MRTTVITLQLLFCSVYATLAQTITKHPENLEVLFQEPAVLSISTDSEVNYQYQWYRDGIAVAGATNDSLFIPQVNELHEGTYYCEIKGDAAVNSKQASIAIKRYDKDKFTSKTRVNTYTGKGIESITAVVTDKYLNNICLGFFEKDMQIKAINDTVTFNSNGDYDHFITKTSPANNLMWAMKIGGKGVDRGGDIEVDEDGNIYCVVNYDSLVSVYCNEEYHTFVGSTSKYYGHYTTLFLKIDPNGNILKAHSFGENSCVVDEMVIGTNGMVIFSGIVTDERVDFDPSGATHTIGNDGKKTAFVVAYNNDMAVAWSRTFSLSSTDYSSDISNYSLAIDQQSSNILLVGEWKGSLTYDVKGVSTASATPSESVFLSTIDVKTGEISRFLRFGNSSSSQAIEDACFDSRGNIIMVGTWGSRDNMSLGLLPADPYILKANNSSHEAFMVKYSPDFFVMGAHRFLASSQTFGSSVTVDANDNIYLAMLGYQVSDIDPSTASVSAEDCIIAAYSPDFQYRWHKSMKATSTVSLNKISVRGNSLLAGGDYQTDAYLNPFEPSKLFKFDNVFDAFSIQFDLPTIPSSVELNLAASAATTSTISLRWNNIASAQTYTVYIDTTFLFNSKYVDSVVVTASTHTFKNLLKDKKYYVKASARGATFRSGYDMIVVKTAENSVVIVTDSLPDIRVKKADVNKGFDLNSHFVDEAGGRLIFGARSSNPAVARVVIVNDSLRVVPVSGGTCTVTAIATNSNGQVATRSFTVEVMASVACTSPELSFTKQDIACYGDNTGSARVIARGGLAPYQYLWIETGRTDSLLVNVKAGSYTVLVTTSDNCAKTGVVTINENRPIAITNTTTYATSSKGGSISVDVSGGSGNKSVAWSTGASSLNITNLETGIYTVTATDLAGCKAEKKLVLRDSCSPLITVDSVKNSPCMEQAGAAYISVIGGSAPYSYKWTDGTTTEDRTSLAAGQYVVTVTDANSCANVAHVNVDVRLPQNPMIGLVTVSKTTGKNIVAWQNEKTNLIDFYTIHRESKSLDSFDYIGKVSYDSLSIYRDLAADPRVRSYRYAISATDKCGNKTPLSPAHQTIHIQSSVGLNNEVHISWNPYEGVPYSSYQLCRQSKSAGLEVVDTLPSSVVRYTDLHPPVGTFNYFVAIILPSPISPAKLKSDSGPYSHSISNIAESEITGMTPTHHTGKVTIYPVPASDLLTIATHEGMDRVSVISSLGYPIMTVNTVQTGKCTLDIKSIPPGFYFINIDTQNGTITKTFVK